VRELDEADIPLKKPPKQKGFAVDPHRWVVERFFAWVGRNRRLWKDPEASLAQPRPFSTLLHHAPLETPGGSNMTSRTNS
jgi:transposase